MGIYPSDTRDQYLRGTFHGYSLQSLIWGVIKTDSYWTRALYPIKNECCSFMSVTINVGDPDKMYTLDYLLYHLHVLKNAAIFGSKKAPTTVPDENVLTLLHYFLFIRRIKKVISNYCFQVWKIALEEEFNITHLNNISSDVYYEIWHSKYSEPEELIIKNRWNKQVDSFN